jgi:protein-L-isoaspartate O-methyltransferase
MSIVEDILPGVEEEQNDRDEMHWNRDGVDEEMGIGQRETFHANENLRRFFTRRQVDCGSVEIELESTSSSLRYSAQPIHLVVQREGHRVFEINHGHGYCAAQCRRDEGRRGGTCEAL